MAISEGSLGYKQKGLWWHADSRLHCLYQSSQALSMLHHSGRVDHEHRAYDPIERTSMLSLPWTRHESHSHQQPVNARQLLRTSLQTAWIWYVASLLWNSSVGKLVTSDDETHACTQVLKSDLRQQQQETESVQQALGRATSHAEAVAEELQEAQSRCSKHEQGIAKHKQRWALQ